MARLGRSFPAQRHLVWALGSALTAGTKTQAGVTRVSSGLGRTSYGSVRIVGSVHTTQTGVAHIVVAGPVSNTQTGVVRIAQIGHTQTGVTRVRASVANTQTGVVRTSAGVHTTQAGLVRAATTPTKTVAGTARLALPQSTRTQPGLVRVVTTRTPSGGPLSGTVRTAKPLTATQAGTVHVNLARTTAAAGAARIRATPTATQAGTVRVATGGQDFANAIFTAGPVDSEGRATLIIQSAPAGAHPPPVNGWNCNDGGHQIALSVVGSRVPNGLPGTYILDPFEEIVVATPISVGDTYVYCTALINGQPVTGFAICGVTGSPGALVAAWRTGSITVAQ